MDNKLIHYLKNKNFRKKKSSEKTEKVKRRISNRWTLKETDVFYRALKLCGLDFTLIADILPLKDRRQVKRKYFKEEKSHFTKIEEIVKNADFDEKQYNTLREDLK